MSGKYSDPVSKALAEGAFGAENTKSMKHCLHEIGEVRYCCWCSLDQHKEYEEKQLHGARAPKDMQRRWHWAPSSLNDCPRDA